MANQNGYEIERKYLIAYPDVKALEGHPSVVKKEITQGYLSGGGRVRKIVCNGHTDYIMTVKKAVTDITRTEKEWPITQEAYHEALNRLEQGTKLIEKTRYCLARNGYVYEIDVFPFWQDRAFLEVELTAEDEVFPFPKECVLIKEVTHDRRYRNSQLAKQPVFEQLPPTGS